VPLPLGQARVKYGHLVTEASPESSYRLRGEADLGNQDDRGPVRSQGELDRSQIDLGLAGAGYA
jgi:hypothetical protein